MQPESQEQITLLQWCRIAQGKYPELKMIYHVPNERKCTARQAAFLRDLGVRPGVPDLCLPVARGEYHGLYIEMKQNGKKAVISPHQKEWIAMLNEQGYKAVVCYGWEEARSEIESYISQ